VERDDVGTRIAERVDVPLRLDDHQMTVEGQCRQAPQVANDLHAPGEVRHEPAVHRVEVQFVGAGALDHRDLGCDRGEVGAEQRRHDLGASRGRHRASASAALGSDRF
jgi:hypothetical protein